jgi:hypothetical protein
MSTRNIPGGTGRTTRKADNLITIYESIVYKMWDPRRLTNQWVSTTCYGDGFTFLYASSNAVITAIETISIT